jgi:hypothetical protein
VSEFDTQVIETTTEPERRRRVLPILIGVIVAAAVGALALLLGSGDGDTIAEPAADEGATATAEVADTESGEEAAEALPLVTYEVFLARDPFEPVVEPEPVAVVETGETAEGGTNAQPVSESEGGTDAVAEFEGGERPNEESAEGERPEGDAPPSDEAPGGCSTDGDVTCDGRIVSLVEIVSEDGEPLAIIQVDTTIYEARRGETFARSFRVSAIEDSCVTLLYGDESFRLCEGNRVLK